MPSKVVFNIARLLRPGVNVIFFLSTVVPYTIQFPLVLRKLNAIIRSNRLNCNWSSSNKFTYHLTFHFADQSLIRPISSSQIIIVYIQKLTNIPFEWSKVNQCAIQPWTNFKSSIFSFTSIKSRPFFLLLESKVDHFKILPILKVVHSSIRPIVKVGQIRARYKLEAETYPWRRRCDNDDQNYPLAEIRSWWPSSGSDR